MKDRKNNTFVVFPSQIISNISLSKISKDFRTSARSQTVFYVCAAITGMIWEMPAVISIATALLVLTALFEVRANFRLAFRVGLSENLKTRRYWLWISVPFLLVLFSAPYTSEMSYFLERLRIKLPFLLLPFAFAVLPPLRKKDLYLIGVFLTGTLVLAAIWVLQNYYFNYEAINEAINRGKAMPTPSSHIRYSLATAGGIFCTFFLAIQDKILGIKGEKIILGTSAVFLFCFMHILSVRSGLLAFYAAAGVLVLLYIYRSRRWKNGIIAISVLLLFPVLAINFIPSLSNKFNYARYDFQQSLAGKEHNLSDGERWISLRAALEIFAENPVFGVGAGDLKEEMKKIYDRQDYTRNVEKMPHSQLVSIAAGTGAVGLMIYLAAFFIPLFKRKNYRSYPLTAWHVIIFSSFLSENTFETNYGVSLWLFGLLVGLSFLENQSVTIKVRST